MKFKHEMFDLHGGQRMAARWRNDCRHCAVQAFRLLFDPMFSTYPDLLHDGKRGEPVSVDRRRVGAA
jgi:hypothetical protein